MIAKLIEIFNKIPSYIHFMMDIFGALQSEGYEKHGVIFCIKREKHTFKIYKQNTKTKQKYLVNVFSCL